MTGYKRKSFMYSLAISRGTWRLFGEPVNYFSLLASGAPHGKLTAGKYKSATRTTQVWRRLSTITAMELLAPMKKT
jgi:hypothetical protein